MREPRLDQKLCSLSSRVQAVWQGLGGVGEGRRGGGVGGLGHWGAGCGRGGGLGGVGLQGGALGAHLGERAECAHTTAPCHQRPPPHERTASQPGRQAASTHQWPGWGGQWSWPPGRCRSAGAGGHRGEGVHLGAAGHPRRRTRTHGSARPLRAGKREGRAGQGGEGGVEGGGGAVLHLLPARVTARPPPTSEHP